MICKVCGQEYEKWITVGPENEMCQDCNDNAWEAWDKDHADDFKMIDEIEAAGHSRHCAQRQVWGDGQCECDLYKKGYDPYAWTKQKDKEL